MAMKFIPGTKIVIWDEDPRQSGLKFSSPGHWRAHQEAIADYWRRQVQAGKAAPAPRQQVDGKEVKALRQLSTKIAERLAVILTPHERAQVKLSSVSTRYPLDAPPGISQKIYRDYILSDLLKQLSRELELAKQAAEFKMTIR
jgi:hypothetical protein